MQPESTMIVASHPGAQASLPCTAADTHDARSVAGEVAASGRIGLAPAAAHGEPLRLLAYVHLRNIHRSTGAGRVARQLTEHLALRPDVDLRLLADRVDLARVVPLVGAPWNGFRYHTFSAETSRQQAIWFGTGRPRAEALWPAAQVVFCTGESYVPTRSARLAVTAHDAAFFEPAAHRRDRTFWTQQLKWRLLFGRLSARADMIHTVSQFSADRLSHFFPSLASRLRVVPNAVTPHFFGPVAADGIAYLDAQGLTHRRFVLVPGGLHFRKNAELVLEGIARLLALDASLLIAIVNHSDPVYAARAEALGPCVSACSALWMKAHCTRSMRMPPWSGFPRATRASACRYSRPWPSARRSWQAMARPCPRSRAARRCSRHADQCRSSPRGDRGCARGQPPRRPDAGRRPHPRRRLYLGKLRRPAHRLSAGAGMTRHSNEHAGAPQQTRQRMVLVQSGARDAYQVGLALEEAGLLEEMVTDLFWPADRAWARRLAEHLPAGLQAMLRQRSEPRVPSDRVRLCAASGLATMLLDKLPGAPASLRRRMTRSADRTLGLTAGRVARERGAALLSYSYYAADAFEQYGAPGTLFQLHPHPASMRRILTDELVAHPECAASLRQEWELALPEREFDRLCAEPRSARHILVASSFTRATLVENGVHRDTIDVIPYGVDAARFTPDRTRVARPGGPPAPALRRSHQPAQGNSLSPRRARPAANARGRAHRVWPRGR